MGNLENRMDKHGNRMSNLENRMDKHGNRMSNLENRMDKLEKRVEGVERISCFEHHLQDHDKRFESSEQYLKGQDVGIERNDQHLIRVTSPFGQTGRHLNEDNRHEQFIKRWDRIEQTLREGFDRLERMISDLIRMVADTNAKYEEALHEIKSLRDEQDRLKERVSHAERH
ncbi:hypothetical protein [Tumebacillus lipolyticus]|uniref:DUF5082 domain-containing protein n=1 Tax=Tumebacillus lipolyticus TaxID=1280370 RepID=A0ABW4ZXX3_9BACL